MLNFWSICIYISYFLLVQVQSTTSKFQIIKSLMEIFYISLFQNLKMMLEDN